MSGIHGYSHKENRQRYRLHRKVKDKKAARIEVRKRTLFVPLDFEKEAHKHERILIEKYGYSAQMEAFFTPPPIENRELQLTPN